ncbi:MAG: hypothetical protein IKN74_01275 [Clostridia bacterium]|nr:hypothetical protein [Bacilli bacterium]MBR3511575.1 hypothetical protein [Clostridia bacterium]
MVKEDTMAYAEIIEILQYMSDEDYYKIPKEELNIFFENADSEYLFKYDPDKTPEENNIMSRTKEILAYLFEKYWANNSQKEFIAKYYDEKTRISKENVKDVNEIFNSNVDEVKEDDTQQPKNEETRLVVEETNIIKKILLKIKSFFFKN